MDRRLFLGAAISASTMAVFSTRAFGAEAYFTGLLPGTALGGYDSVAYFTVGEAIVGDEAITTEYQGVIWRFSSQKNLDMFVADPLKYAPQFGGYCAYAASKGYLAKGDPEAWTVHEGKLYINFNKTVRDIWKQDMLGNIKKANVLFPKIVSTQPNVTSW